MNAQSLLIDVAPHLGIEDGDQRFTTRETDAWCRKVAGVEQWDLDVAACDESHLASKFYEKADDGLTKPWFGRVWCNPPFSDIEPWVEKAWAEMARNAGPDAIAMLLPASRTEQPWFQALVEPYRDGKPYSVPPTGAVVTERQGWASLTTHFLPGRTRFGHPGNLDGVGVGSPPFGCVLLCWRRS